MHGRLLLLLLLVLSVPASSVRVQAATAFPQIGLGYSPATLAPTDQGIPIYTVGDELWIVSYGSPLNVELLNSSFRPAGTFSLGHMQPTLLRVFSASDKPGFWLLNFTTFATGPGFSGFSIELVKPGVILPQMTNVHVDPAGIVSYDFRANLGLAYETSACLAGQNSLESVPIPIPASLGTGQLVLTRNGSLTTIQPNGKILTPFSFWFELHAGRTYEGAATLVTRDQEEAATVPLPFSAGSSNQSTVGLASSIAVREGRATIRVFFESSAGLQTYQTPVLIPDTSTWDWLPGCTSSMNNVGSNFNASASLRISPDLWPRSMYLMYAEFGVEAFSRVPISVFPSVVNLIASPWGVPLTDKGLSLAPLVGATAAVGNSSVFVVSSTYPMSATLRIHGTSIQPLLLAQPFSIYTVQLPAGKIVVQSLLNGGAVSNSTVSLRLGNQTVASGKGSPTFYVPGGSYTLFASYRGINRSVEVSIANSNQATFSIEFGNPASQADYVLMVTAIVGTVAGVILWASLIRDFRRKSKFP